MTDIVITYVNPNDAEWLKNYQKTSNKKLNQAWFFDWEFLRFIFRGIEANMSWVNNIYLVVASESQVPAWINQSNVHIVTHKNIIPANLLPTFNSCTIEMFLHKIPGLSEQFIYLNDDTIPLNPTKETDYFENGIAKTSMGRHILTSKHIPGSFLNQCYNSTKTALEAAGQPTGMYYLQPTHSCTTLLKSVCQEFYDKKQEQILKSTSKLRNNNNLNQYAFLVYMKLVHKLQSSSLTHRCISFNHSLQSIIQDIASNNKWICINDGECDDSHRNQYKLETTKAFEKKYPNKSKYETEGIIHIIPKPHQKNLKKTVIKSDIDFVFPYVTMDDPEWVKQYNKYCPKIKEIQNSWSAGVERFRDAGLLKYMFRSVAKNMPWIHKMHMIVASESQVPNWVNRDTVDIILHKDFIPEQHLPTFNSSTIEMWIGRIKGVNNKFIYSNDDIYITKPLSITDFFNKETPIYSLEQRNFSQHAPGDVMRQMDMKLIDPKFDQTKVVITQHICTPHTMSNIRECLTKYSEQIDKSCTKFREDRNYNQYIYLYNQLNKKQFINKKISPILSTCIGPKYMYCKEYSTYKLCCLNDSNDSRPQDIAHVTHKLNKLFPTKCKYEK